MKPVSAYNDFIREISPSTILILSERIASSYFKDEKKEQSLERHINSRLNSILVTYDNRTKQIPRRTNESPYKEPEINRPTQNSTSSSHWKNDTPVSYPSQQGNFEDKQPKIKQEQEKTRSILGSKKPNTFQKNSEELFDIPVVKENRGTRPKATLNETQKEVVLEAIRESLDLDVFQINDKVFRPVDIQDARDFINSDKFDCINILTNRLEDSVNATLENSNLCLQLNIKGETHLNPRGVVSRKEALESIFNPNNEILQKIFKSKIESIKSENNESLYVKDGIEIDNLPLNYLTYTRILLEEPKFYIRESSLNLPITKLELASYLVLTSYINTKINNSYYEDLEDIAIVRKDNISLSLHANIKEPEYWVNRILSGKSFLTVNDVSIVSNMLRETSLVSKRLGAMERISRLEFMFIFSDYLGYIRDNQFS